MLYYSSREVQKRNYHRGNHDANQGKFSLGIRDLRFEDVLGLEINPKP